VKLGCGVIVWENWSAATAAKVFCPPVASEALAGVTTTVVRTCVTAALTVEVVVWPRLSRMLTVKV